jgi:hypothetical protein
MFRFAFLFFPWGIILQVLAVVHFVRRRPDTYWLYIIIFLGPLGAIAYLLIEAAPDLTLLRGSFQTFPRRGRIREMLAAVQQNPSPGNYEELADLYFENKNYAKAHDCYDRAITTRSDFLDPFYRRGLSSYYLGDFTAAIPDLEFVTGKQFGYDFERASGLLADCYARTNQPEKAEPLFRRTLQASSKTETQYNYAEFLAAHGRAHEARDITQQILHKKVGMKSFQKRLERPWLRRASALMKRLPA